MKGQLLYNVPHALAFGWPIALYFYFTGLSAGSFFISVLVRLMGLTPFKKVGRIAAVLAPLLLILAPVFLVADLEQPLRFYRVLIYQNPTSAISYGAYLLTLYPINALLYAYFLFRDEIRESFLYRLGGAFGLNRPNADKMTYFFGILGIPLAVAVHGYTGFIVGLAKSRELWNTALMPTLFLVSALVSGIALVIIVSILWDRNADANAHLRASLGKMLGAVLLVDLFMVFSDILILSTGKTEAHHAAQLLLTGDFAGLFLGVEIFLGAIVPLAILFNQRTANRTAWQATASVLVLIGVLVMRYVLVVGGQMIPLS